MNDKTAEDALKEIFDTLDDPGEGEENRVFDDFESTGDDAEGILGFSEFTESPEFSDFEEFKSGSLPAAESDRNLSAVGVNWGALFWLVILLASIGALIYTELEESARAQNHNRIASASAELDSQINQIGQLAVLALTGRQGALESIGSLKEGITANIELLTFGDEASVLSPASTVTLDELQQIEQSWNSIKPDIDILLENQNIIGRTEAQVEQINALIPQLLVKTDDVVGQLIENQASLEQINIASRQRFLTQRIKSSANELVRGGAGGEVAVTQFGRDVKLFGQIQDTIALQSGPELAGGLDDVGNLYQELVSGAETLMNNIGDYFTMQGSVDRVIEGIGSMSALSKNLHVNMMEMDEAPAIENLSYILGGAALFALLALFWSILSHTKKYALVDSQRSQVSEDAVIKLLDEMGDLAQGDLTVEAEVTDEITGAIADSINFAVGEMRGLVTSIKSAAGEMDEATNSTETLIAQLLTTSGAQSQEIGSAAGEVTDMTEAIHRMNESAIVSTQQARLSAEVAHKGAEAVRNTVRGMNMTRNQIQETAKQLKRLGESSQQINEIVDLIQDVTEQTNILSLNASIQAAMAGEAGRGFAVVAEEVQRLAERSASASRDITALVKNIQQDANSAITSMESTTEEVVSGAITADEAGKALTEIESVSQELLNTIDQVGEDAQHEFKVANTVANRMKTLQSTTTESDLSVSEVAVALEQMKSVTERLNRSISGFKLPES
jgi:twitching motility protein PilJ